MKTAESYYQAGLKLIENENFDLAVKCFNRALDRNPGSAKVLHKRGVSYKLMNDFDRAKKDSIKALETDPHYFPSYYELGCLYGKDKDYIASVNAFSKALETGPDFSLLYGCRGYSYGELQDFHQAILDYDMTLELFHESVDGIDEEIRFLYKTNKKFTLPGVYFNRGVNKEKVQDYNGAIFDYSEAIKINKLEAKYYYRRGECKIYMGNLLSGYMDVNISREMGYLTSFVKPLMKPN